MLIDDLRETLRGDLAAFRRLRSVDHAQLLQVSVDLKVDPVAVRRVLNALVDGTAGPEEVQAWASFMRRGYLPSSHGPIHPLAIEYVSEDVVSEVISRLDELGDLVDGEIGESELESMIAALET